jgi:hypothetical protein
MDILFRLLLLPSLALSLPYNASAVLVEFESTCNNDAPFVAGSNGNCALFGLSETDTVSGSFTYADALFTPGSGISLQNDQYEFLFTFGNQTFTEADNTLDLGFVVDSSGTVISSIAGVFINAADAQLNLLTPSTVRILLGAEGADTFGEGAIWTVTGPTAIPLPAAIWLFVSGLFMSSLLIKRRRSELIE